MSQSPLKEVAVFPIPNCVAFPGTIFPLHVFEPRYREMVAYCLEKNVPLAITHTEALIRPAKRSQTREEILSSNQATYEPYRIFSAGKVALVETLADGRLLINVHLTDRLEAVKQSQASPFLLFQCRIYQDRPLDDAVMSEAIALKDKILQRLLSLVEGNEPVATLLKSSEWQNKSPLDFSFELFGLVQMDGDIRQQILQCRSLVERLNIAWQLMQ